LSLRPDGELVLLGLEESQGDAGAVADTLVVAVGVGAEELDLNLLLDVIFAQVCRPDLNLIPDELFTAKRLLNLRLVHGDPLARAQILVDDEEVEAAGA